MPADPREEPKALPRIDALLRDARARLLGDEAAIDAEHLLCAVLGRSRAWLFAHADDVADAAQVARYRALLDARASGTPVAHLLGRRGFWTLDLEVSAATLIPRPETELLVEAALQRLPADRPLHVADLGTGSGAVAVALAHERPSWRVVATDVDRQSEYYEDVLDIESFQDPVEVGKFLERFTAMWEAANPTGSYDPLTAFQSSSLTGISTDLLISINNLKLGGR